jgi:hypothetical protein
MESSTVFAGEEAQRSHFPQNVAKPEGLGTVKDKIEGVRRKKKTKGINFVKSHGIQERLKGDDKC